jgi:[protein-PII] uridylyltransferase
MDHDAALAPDPDPEASTLVAALALLGTPATVSRDDVLAAFRRHLGRLQTHVRNRFEAGELGGLQAARLLASLTDGLIAALHAHALALHQPSGSPAAKVDPLGRLAVVATGGYGRGVLAPFSDIDLLFLTGEEPSDAVLRAVEFMLYFLWDLGLKVGHATRSLDSCLTEANGDVTVRTSLMDARRVAGDAALFKSFVVKFRAACDAAGAGAYLEAKRNEREIRHHRYGDSPFVVEPNIKEGRGGLRDLQTLYWMAHYVFGIRSLMTLTEAEDASGGLIRTSEGRLAMRSWDFLWALRFNLHYVSGRAEERLTFDLQPVVGARMGYTRHGRQDGVERFMRHYFLTARDVTRLTAVLEPALLRAAMGPPAIAAETDPALVAAGFVLADGKTTISTTSRSRCSACCEWRGIAGCNCIRWPSAR